METDGPGRCETGMPDGGRPVDPTTEALLRVMAGLPNDRDSAVDEAVHRLAAAVKLLAHCMAGELDCRTAAGAVIELAETADQFLEGPQ